MFLFEHINIYIYMHIMYIYSICIYVIYIHRQYIDVCLLIQHGNKLISHGHASPQGDGRGNIAQLLQ